jgi:hypothetical protein
MTINTEFVIAAHSIFLSMAFISVSLNIYIPINLLEGKTIQEEKNNWK